MKIVQIAEEIRIEEDARIPVRPIGLGRAIEAIPISQMERAQIEITSLTGVEYPEICAPNAGPDVMGSVAQRILRSVIRAGTSRRFRSFG